MTWNCQDTDYGEIIGAGKDSYEPYLPHSELSVSRQPLYFVVEKEKAKLKHNKIILRI